MYMGRFKEQQRHPGAPPPLLLCLLTQLGAVVYELAKHVCSAQSRQGVFLPLAWHLNDQL